MTLKELDERMRKLGFRTPVITDIEERYYNYANLSEKHSIVMKFNKDLNDWTVASYKITDCPLRDAKALTAKQIRQLLEIMKELPNIKRN